MRGRRRIKAGKVEKTGLTERQVREEEEMSPEARGEDERKR